MIHQKSVKLFQISLKMPKSESGFEVDYSDFVLPPVSEATLKIGWVPSKPGNCREKVMVKYGVRDSQVILLGSCFAPTRGRRIPLQNFNSNRAQMSGKAGKTGDNQQQPKLPENPVKRLIGQLPEIRKMKWRQRIRRLWKCFLNFSSDTNFWISQVNQWNIFNWNVIFVLT